MARKINWIKSILAVLLLIGLVLSHLALTDIGKGIESGLSSEWLVVRVTFLLAAALAVLSIISDRLVLQR